VSELHLAQLAGGLLALTSLIGLAVAFSGVRLSRRELLAVTAQPLAAAVTWVALGSLFEGRVLVELSVSHGITAGDLLVVLPLTVVGLLVTEKWR
jgi:hypothetical protein